MSSFLKLNFQNHVIYDYKLFINNFGSVYLNYYVNDENQAHYITTNYQKYFFLIIVIYK
jgi:hypothetical protein